VPPKEKKNLKKRHQWLMPVILAAWETEILRFMAQGQPGQIIINTPSPK
jgi:hypothetical protein